MKIVEITPKSMLCGIGACPAIFETNDTYIIVGKKPPDLKIIRRKVGASGIAIEIPKEILSGLLQKQN